MRSCVVLLIADKLCGIFGQALVEVGQPLAVYERLEDPPYLVVVILCLYSSKEAEFDDLADLGIYLVDQPGLVAAVRHEDTDGLSDLIATENEAGIGAFRIEFGELLTQ